MTLLERNVEFGEKELRTIHQSYRHPLREKRVKTVNDRLVIVNLIDSASIFLTLIIVPKALCRIVCNAFHCTPMGAHMKTFKTLLLIRLRFIWPDMRKEIFDWVRGCLGCFPARGAIRESSGLLQSWPITTPFAIISVDIWKPGEMSDYTGRSHLLNCMCDMT